MSEGVYRTWSISGLEAGVDSTRVSSVCVNSTVVGLGNSVESTRVSRKCCEYQGHQIA